MEWFAAGQRSFCLVSLFHCLTQIFSHLFGLLHLHEDVLGDNKVIKSDIQWKKPMGKCLIGKVPGNPSRGNT